MEQLRSTQKTNDGTSVDVFSEIQQLVQRLAGLEQDLQQLVRGQIDAVIDPNSGHIILLRQAQEALHSNERQLRALFESALDAIVIADDEGCYVDANPAACELFGMPRESLIGRNVSDFATDELNVDHVWQTFRIQNQSERGIFRLRRPDGSIREAEYSATPDFLPGRHLSVLRDVTERRRTEDALRRSEERFRSLIEYSNDVIVLIDGEGQLTYASPSVERILGFEPTSLLGTAALENVYPDDAAQAAWMLADLLHKPGNIVSGQLRLTHANGSSIWIEGVGNNLLDVESVRAIVVNFRDITVRRQTEEALLETTTTLQTMIESSPLGIIAIDSEHRITTWNPAAERIFGWQAEEVLGRILPYIPPNREAEAEARLHQLFEERRFILFETQRLKRDGTLIDVSIASAPIIKGAEEVVGGMSIITDITELKQAERIREAVAIIATALRSASTSHTMLSILLDEIGTLLQPQGSEVTIYTEDTQIHLQHSSGRQSLAPADTFPALLNAALQEKRTLASTNIYLDPRFGPDLPSNLLQAQVYTPILVDGEPIGVMQLGRATPFSEAEIRLLNAVTDIAATSIQRAILYEEVQKSLNRTNALYTVAQHLISTKDLPRLLGSVVDGIEAVLNADWVNLAILGQDIHAQTEPISAGNLDNVTQTPHFQAWMARLMDRAMQQREGMVLGGTALGDDSHSETSWPTIGSVMVTPLLYQDQILGTLVAANRTRDKEFSNDDLTVLTALANQASVAIANTRFVNQIQEQADQLQRVMDGVSDGLVLLAPDQRILLANPAAEEMLAQFGEVSDEGQLKSFSHVPLETLLTLPGAGRAAHEVEPFDGAPATFEVMSHVMGAGDGRLLVLRDVTEDRENRQRAMQQGQLAAVGQLAAGIAHDFNNIMGAIVIYSQLMRNTLNLNGKNRERLDVIHQQAQYAAELVRQLLDFSRTSVLERRSLNAVPFCKDLVKLLERILPETIEISFTTAKPNYQVTLDPARFQQALINMAVNARDAMPNGGQLHLHLEDFRLNAQDKPPLPDMTPGAWLSIEISDNGGGIPGSVLGRIFEPFFSTKDRGKGSGLGLAQVYGIVQQHNGFIKVHSAVNEGTTFVIYLPLVDGAETKDQLVMTQKAEHTRHRCILVVEDNVATRDALVDFLDINGYEVLTAKDGQEAVHVFQAHQDKIDLVLSDMIMPRLGGLELSRELRTVKPDVKMILMTGYPLQEDGRHTLEKGGIAWLQKPFEVEALISMMQKLW
jgi:PAS domain S-box-containing protein